MADSWQKALAKMLRNAVEKSEEIAEAQRYEMQARSDRSQAESDARKAWDEFFTDLLEVMADYPISTETRVGEVLDEANLIKHARD